MYIVRMLHPTTYPSLSQTYFHTHHRKQTLLMATSPLCFRPLPTSFQHQHTPFSTTFPPLQNPFLTFSTRSKPTSLITSKKLVDFKPKAAMTTSSVPPSNQAKKVEIFDTENDLASSLAKYTAELSDKFTKERGSFTVVLSGGSLIKSLRKLLEAPYIDSIEWSKWHVFWVDERVVPKDHQDSNYKLAFDGFLSQVPILPGNVCAINDALSAEGAADDYETCLKHLVHNNIISSSFSGFPKFDLMLLGMGPDGHVASLFPGHPLVNENERWVSFIKDSPKPPPERITFTFPVINSSAYIALVVCGNGKFDAVSRALGGNQNVALPVQLVSPEGELKWFLDKSAASKLQGW